MKKSIIYLVSTFIVFTQFSCDKYDFNKTFDFRISVFTNNISNTKIELADAKLTIFEGATKVIDATFSTATETVTLTDNKIDFILKLEKEGFIPWVDTMSAAELKEFSSTPLEVTLSSNGLVVFYPFNGNANDIGPNKYNGVNYNAALIGDRHGNANSAYDFKLDKGYIVIPKLGNIIPSNEISVSLWERDSVSATNCALILGPWDSSVDCFAIAINSSHAGINTIFWDFGFMQAGGDAPGRLYYRPSPIDKNWHHFVFISSVLGNTMKIYRDNILVISKTECLPLNNQAGKDLNIGRYFSGALDDIRIFNRAITVGEINALYSE